MARRGPFTTCKPEYGYDASDDVLLARKDARKQRGLASPDAGDALAFTHLRLFGGATLRDEGSPQRGTAPRAEEEDGLPTFADNAKLRSSFGKRKSKKPLDRTEQCCGVSLPTLT